MYRILGGVVRWRDNDKPISRKRRTGSVALTEAGSHRERSDPRSVRPGARRRLDTDRYLNALLLRRRPPERAGNGLAPRIGSRQSVEFMDAVERRICRTLPVLTQPEPLVGRCNCGTSTYVSAIAFGKSYYSLLELVNFEGFSFAKVGMLLHHCSKCSVGDDPTINNGLAILWSVRSISKNTMNCLVFRH